MTRGFEVIVGGPKNRITAMEAWCAATTARMDRTELRLGPVEAPPR